MAEENIWKKQAQMNRLKAEGKTDPPSPSKNVTLGRQQTDSPINAFIKSSNTSSPAPPWAKNSPQNTSPPQPGWAKNATTTPANTSSQPSWATKPASPPKTPPIPLKEPNNPVPWAKNPTSTQPSWAKNQPSGQSSNQSNQPSWLKNNPNPSTSSQPSWANKNEKVGSQPSWAKNAEQLQESPRSKEAPQLPWIKNNENPPKAVRTSGDQSSLRSYSNLGSNSNLGPSKDSTPSWMKEKQLKDENSKVNSNSWKLQQSFEIEKQKQQLEEKIRKQEEQERERKRIDKERREQEEEERSMLREQKMMADEEQNSEAREQSDREEERQKRQREQEQRKRQEEEQRKLQEKIKKQQEEQKIRREEKQRRIEEDEEQKRKAQEEILRVQAEENQRKEKQRLTELDRTSKTEQQKVRKGPSSKRRKKEFMENSKISHISSIKGLQNMNLASDPEPSQPDDNLYHKYLRLINEETMEYDYKKKIELQKYLYQLQLQCRRECESEVISLFSNKKITNRKRKFIFSNSMQIQYALCQGRQGESGLEFVNQEIQELKTRFLQYETLTKCVLSLMKKKINLRLRVPLMNYAEHKGVSFLVEHVCQELIDIIEIQIGLFQEIANEVLVFEKELQLSYEEQSEFKSITKDQLMIKKITIYGEDYYILYLKYQAKPSKSKGNSNSAKALSKLQPRYSNLNDISILEYIIIGQNTLFPYYQPPVEVTKQIYQQMQKISAPALKNILKSLCLAKAIDTVYSSCQGEVEEESFFKLVLEGNNQIWDMIAAAGSPDREVPKPLVLAVLQKFSSVEFKFSSKMYSPKSKELMKSAKPSVYIQRYDYELLEFIQNIEKYIVEDKQELVEQSMMLSRQLWEDIRQGQTQDSFSFLKLKSQVAYLLYRQKESEALELIDKALEEIGKLTLQSIPLFLLAIKIYVAKDMEVPMLKALSELLPTLEFYFGEESMLHALVYTAVGIYYSKKAEEPESVRSQKVVTFYEHSLKIALKLYGEKAQEVADIFLSRASAFINLGKYDLFNKDIQNAVKIFKAHSKSGPKIAECNHLMGRVLCLEGNVGEGIELMELSSSQYMKMYSHIESLCILFQILPFLAEKETELELKIESIVQICFTYKSIWAFKRIATMVLDRELNCYTSLNIQNLQELFLPLDEDDRTNEEVLIDLQEEIKGFTSFIEIVRWALSIIAGKLAARREITGDYEKAHAIIREVFHFYGKNQSMSMDLKDSQLL